MKTYYNGPKGMRYGGSTRKPMMYGGMPKKRKKKMMGGMNTGMSAPMPMNNMMNRQKMATGEMVKRKKKKPFPDLTGDGKVSYADILKGRGVDKA